MVLYALGSNGSGQLGIGHSEDVAVPTRHELKFDSDVTCPVAIAGGGNHTLILTTAGYLYASGDLSGHVDRALMMQKTAAAKTMLLSQDVSHCSAMWESSILCYAERRLSSIGRGERGELGRGASSDPSSLEVLLEALLGEEGKSKAVVSVASGLQHTVVVLSDGQVYGWGNGRKGQLGEPLEAVVRPRKIQGVNFLVKRVTCGREFTYLVGDELEGQHVVLGSDKWGVRSQAPPDVGGWADIGASWGSIFVLLRSGGVVSWGRNDHGQLASPSLPSLSKIACGSEHCLGLTEDGRVLAWGWGEHGNCGSPIDAAGDTKPTWNELPVVNNHEHVEGIAAGCATSWIWTSTHVP